jgi:hypothetical protein
MNLLKKVTNVPDDGHCGFRAIVGLHDMAVDDYQIIHYQILKELADDGSEHYL